MEIKDSQCVRVPELQELFGISNRQVYHLRDLEVFHPVSKGRYDLAQCIQAWGEYHRQGTTSNTIAEEKRKLIDAQRRKVELDIRERSKELIAIDLVKSAFNEAMVLVAGQLDGLPGRIAATLAGISEPAIIRQTLFEETRRIRDAAATQLKDFANNRAGGGDPETTATEDG